MAMKRDYRITLTKKGIIRNSLNSKDDFATI